ncbi:MAG: hypothetical protein OEM00_02670 [Burkholderiaceae bacterium]|nr:hypothetical protein [Burkholderiaceae bacterium]
MSKAYSAPISALSRLAHAEGSVEAVANKARVSAKYLRQLLAATKSRTGRVRTMGVRVQEKLDAAFPGWWLLQPMDGIAIEERRGISVEEWTLLLDLEVLLPEERNKFVRDIHTRAETFRAYARSMANKDNRSFVPVAAPEQLRVDDAAASRVSGRDARRRLRERRQLLSSISTGQSHADDSPCRTTASRCNLPHNG